MASNEYNNEIFHNLFEHKVLYHMAGGVIFRNKSPLNYYMQVCYLSVVVITDLYLCCECVYTMSNLPVEDLPTQIKVFFFLSLLLTNLLMTYICCAKGRTIREASDIIVSGVHDHRCLEEEELEILKKRVYQVKGFERFITLCCLGSPISSTFLLPVGAYLFHKESPLDEFLNPYLPLPIHTAFDSSNVIGYIAALSMQGICLMTIYIKASFIAESFISFCLQLTGQLEVLNYSINSILINAERCRKIYEESKKFETESSETLDINCFMFDALRENIIHHIAILRYVKVIRPFLELVNISCVLVFCVMLSIPLLLILKDPKGQLALIFMCVISAFGYMAMCTVGEIVITKSSDLQESLYNMPWYNCNKKISQVTGIMITYAQFPIVIRTPGMNLNSSLKTYSDMISSGYKFLNLLWTMI